MKTIITEGDLEAMNRMFMKFGFRKPSLKKSIKDRTTGKIKRKVKKKVNPFYGKKGTGWVRRTSNF